MPWKKVISAQGILPCNRGNLMNTNPEPEYIEQYLAYWREHSLECLRKTREYKKEKAKSLLKEDWEWLTERKNVFLVF
jgi:hypothetical protein